MSDITLHPSATEIDAVRNRLQHARGKQFWRSLDDLADTSAFREYLEREFPRGAAELNDSVSRRTFLKLMGASLALAGLSGCTTAMRQPQEKVAPFTHLPLTQTPGIPIYYATALALDGFGMGVAVRNYDGRPIKIEGNPQHPASLGATDIYAQADILGIYDPDRPETVLQQGVISTWESFLAALTLVMQTQRNLGGQGLRVLTSTVTSPTLAAQLEEMLVTFPNAKWVQYDPVGRSNTYEGTKLAFGEYLEPRYLFDKADLVVALDADFLTEGPGRVRYARDAMGRRSVRMAQSEMSRVYAIEPVLSNTGIIADHRLPVKASQVAVVAFAVASALGVPGIVAPVGLPEAAAPFVTAIADDLRAAGSKALVLAGESQPPVVHALAHVLNTLLGAVGTTVEYTDPVAARPGDQTAALRGLVDELKAGAVDALVVIDANPAFAAPADLAFGEAMAMAKFKAVLGPYADETAALADWFVPMAHALESWGDVRAFDGSTTIIQPLILPLYGSHTPYELMASLLGQTVGTDYEIVSAAWQQRSGLADAEFATFLKSSLNNGVVENSALPARNVGLAGGLSLAAPAVGEGYEVIFRPSPTIHDGRYANNGWLMELPSPITKLTWDNAALVGVKTAIKLFGLDREGSFNTALLSSTDDIERQHTLEKLTSANGSMIELIVADRSLKLPIWIVPGHAEDTITVHLGYGRSIGGRVAEGAGFNAYSLRPSEAPWFASANARPTDGSYLLVSTQDHWTMEGRDIVRVGEIAKFKEDPGYLTKEILHEEFGAPTHSYESMMPGVDYSKGNQWAMTIDLSACISCNACTIACQAENNIPVIGKHEVSMGREMHWIRIDRYFAGADYDNPETYVMPMTCQQCENAPCELVCPVVATVHDAEGINNMIYNRCVGTKYCSNNCPYKVRRFNFLQYVDNNTASLKLMRNPDVTVRIRGVMEKCTYCIQRISQVRIKAQVENNRPIADREILTACEQVCPTQAITFGDKNNPQSKVATLKQEPHNYTVLDDLNTVPRTSYLARMRNLNSTLGGGEG
ncbi:TAT-variant-translocated molybdopterin oxidoreductase [Chloroflexales bacterium ZM16-3]|nr:TAT-variant-translocated molybdopterin oxidoreductase [Chloroflexales bacterium ZM16-3]